MTRAARVRQEYAPQAAYSTRDNRRGERGSAGVGLDDMAKLSLAGIGRAVQVAWIRGVTTAATRVRPKTAGGCVFGTRLLPHWTSCARSAQQLSRSARPRRESLTHEREHRRPLPDICFSFAVFSSRCLPAVSPSRSNVAQASWSSLFGPILSIMVALAALRHTVAENPASPLCQLPSFAD